MKRPIVRSASIGAALILTLALVPAAPLTAQSVETDAEQIAAVVATTAANAACPGEDVKYDPGNGQDIVVPRGYKVEVFARDLNFPTGLAFMRSGDSDAFKILIVESGTGLPGRCNNNADPAWGGRLSKTNPFTPDVLVLDQDGKVVRGPL